MTGLVSTSRAMRSTSACAAARSRPSSLRTKNFPWRTSRTAVCPREASACWIAAPLRVENRGLEHHPDVSGHGVIIAGRAPRLGPERRPGKPTSRLAAGRRLRTRRRRRERFRRVLEAHLREQGIFAIKVGAEHSGVVGGQADAERLHARAAATDDRARRPACSGTAGAQARRYKDCSWGRLRAGWSVR